MLSFISWTNGRLLTSSQVLGLFVSCFFCSHKVIAVIDLCRLLAAFSPDALKGVGEVEQFIEALLKAAEWPIPWSLPLSKSRETNILLVLRTLANIIQERTQLSSTQYSLVRPSILSKDTTSLQVFEPDL